MSFAAAWTRPSTRTTCWCFGERVGVSVSSLGKLEAGNPYTSLATMPWLLTVLGMAADIDLLAAQDTLGSLGAACRATP